MAVPGAMGFTPDALGSGRGLYNINSIVYSLDNDTSGRGSLSSFIKGLAALFAARACICTRTGAVKMQDCLARGTPETPTK